MGIGGFNLRDKFDGVKFLFNIFCCPIYEHIIHVIYPILISFVLLEQIHLLELLRINS